MEHREFLDYDISQKEKNLRTYILKIKIKIVFTYCKSHDITSRISRAPAPKDVNS